MLEAMPDLFTPEERAVWGGFVVVQARVFGQIEDHLRSRFGITHGEFEVLLRLTLSPASQARIQDLSDASLLSPSGTSRAVSRLVRAGHVERVGAAEDGRGAYARLTESGRSHLLAAAKDHVALIRRAFLTHLTEVEASTIAAIWDRVLQAGSLPSDRDANPGTDPGESGYADTSAHRANQEVSSGSSGTA